MKLTKEPKIAFGYVILMLEGREKCGYEISQFEAGNMVKALKSATKMSHEDFVASQNL